MASSPQVADSRRRVAAFENKRAKVDFSWPKACYQMIGVKRGCINRTLQCHAVVDVIDEKQKRPLLLLITTRGSEGQIWSPVLKHHGGR